MAEEDGDKSHDPTQHRRDEARKQGQVVHSQDLGSAALLLAGIILLLALGNGPVEFFGVYTQRQLGGDAWLSADPQFVTSHWVDTGIALAKVMLPMLGFVMLTAVIANLAQTGLLFLPEKVAMDITRLDPLKGLGRIFSLANLVKLIFGIFKIILVGAVAYWSLYSRRDEILLVTAMELPQIASFIIDITLWTSLKIAAALVILSILDYGFQRWKHEQDLKMTHQEIREEIKEQNGDPQMVARRRQVQRQLILNRLSTAVPKADVVVTNPTELAIAIQYDHEKMAAPVVVAKGAGPIAQRIRRLALENGIPIIEKKPLAQTLYKEVELNHPIPDKLYGAVAELLAYVYQLKGKAVPGR